MYQSNILKTAFENAEGVWLKDSNFAHPVLLEAEGESRKWELGWWEGARITESCKGVVATVWPWCSPCVDMENAVRVVLGSRVWGQCSVAASALLCHS